MDGGVYVCCAGSQLSDNTRVCAYMYKTVEHLSIHNADDDESSEDYGAADVQVTIIWQYCNMRKVLELLKGLHPYYYNVTGKLCVLWHK